MARPVAPVIGGVDTHKDAHVVAALSERGAPLGTATFAANSGWLRSVARLAPGLWDGDERWHRGHRKVRSWSLSISAGSRCLGTRGVTSKAGMATSVWQE